jgi:phosphopantetheinyl transferase
MPLVYQQNINETTKLGVWHITEQEDFFLRQVPVQREISHPHKRLQHLAGRLLLKELYPDFPYELIRIADTRKPFLANEVYHFSISHCGDYAAVIVSKKDRVGVDIERFNPKVDNVKYKFLSAAEQEIIFNAQYSMLNIQLVTAAWSIKEAIYKWYGDGGLDFKEHIHIEKILINDENGNAICRLSKEKVIELTVHFIFFNDNCLSWIVSSL